MIIGGLVIVYGSMLAWLVMALLTLKNRRAHRVFLIAHLAMSSIAALWLVSSRWAPGMVVLMVAPGACVSAGRLVTGLVHDHRRH
ncbi:hypothetical protein [Sphaerisporangium rhizosphaerae]|uniref:Uncharacterized protein n=1 Tax=Sphaerisporangium rhizosphaerae TaxID=2269375 RepID=A0ABW2PAD0_9ACTN